MAASRSASSGSSNNLVRNQSNGHCLQKLEERYLEWWKNKSSGTILYQNVFDFKSDIEKFILKSKPNCSWMSLRI